MSHNLSHALSPNELIPWQTGPRERGALSIILSCLAVIGTCTWTTLHLTVPGPGWSWYKGLMRKVKWMGVMVIFPEFVFAHAVVELKMALDDYFAMNQQKGALSRMRWSVRPTKAARFAHRILSGRWISPLATQAPEETDPPSGPTHDTTRNEESTADPDMPYLSYTASPPTPRKERVWTLTHCYFANMGGIGLEYEEHRWDNGGTTVKTVLVQGDFIATTPNSTDQQEAEIIGTIDLLEADILDKSKADSFMKLLWIWEIVRLVIEIIARAIRHLPITQLEIITASFAAISLATVLVQMKKPKDVARPVYFPYAGSIVISAFKGTATLASLSFNFIRTWPGFMSITAEQRDELNMYYWEVDFSGFPARRIPNDYFRATEENEKLFFAMLCLSTGVFGIIHCGAWAFEFPTTIEKWVWRGCALASIALPLVMLFVLLFLRAKHRQRKEDCRHTEEAFLDALRTVHRFTGDTMRYYSEDRPAQKTAAYFVKILERTRRRGSIDDRLEESVADLVATAEPFDTAVYANYQWTKVIEWAQIPAMVVYLLARIAIIVVAVACFRSAPRGIYWGTWANFLPALR